MRTLGRVLQIILASSLFACGYLSQQLKTSSLSSVDIKLEISSTPSNNKSDSSISFSGSASAGIKIVYTCSLDGGAFASCASPYSFSGLSAGSHTFVLRATDSSSGQYVDKTYQWTVDLSENIYFYAASNTDNKIQGFTYNKNTGALTSFGSQVSATNLNGMFPSSNGKFMFAAGYSGHEYYGWTVSSSGLLTAMSGSPWGLPAGAQSCSLDPTNSFLYVVDETPTVSNFSLSSSGAPTAIASQASLPVGGAGAWTSTVHPSGKFLYIGSYTDGKVYGFDRNMSNGTLTAMSGSPFASLGATSYVRTDAAGKFLFVSAWGVGMRSSVINQTTGAITTATTISSPSGLMALAPHPSSGHLLVTDWQNKKVYGYSVDQTTGVLTALGGAYPVSVPNITYGALTFDKLGNYLYAGTSDGKIYIFSFDSSTGQITAISGSPSTVPLSSVEELAWVQPAN